MEPSNGWEQRSCWSENLETRVKSACSPYNGNLHASQDLHTCAVRPTWLKTFPGVSAGSPMAAKPCFEEKQEIRRVVEKEKKEEEEMEGWSKGERVKKGKKNERRRGEHRAPKTLVQAALATGAQRPSPRGRETITPACARWTLCGKSLQVHYELSYSLWCCQALYQKLFNKDSQKQTALHIFVKWMSPMVLLITTGLAEYFWRKVGDCKIFKPLCDSVETVADLAIEIKAWSSRWFWTASGFCCDSLPVPQLYLSYRSLVEIIISKTKNCFVVVLRQDFNV